MTTPQSTPDPRIGCWETLGTPLGDPIATVFPALVGFKVRPVRAGLCTLRAFTAVHFTCSHSAFGGFVQWCGLRSFKCSNSVFAGFNAVIWLSQVRCHNWACRIFPGLLLPTSFPSPNTMQTLAVIENHRTNVIPPAEYSDPGLSITSNVQEAMWLFPVLQVPWLANPQFYLLEQRHFLVFLGTRSTFTLGLKSTLSHLSAKRQHFPSSHLLQLRRPLGLCQQN